MSTTKVAVVVRDAIPDITVVPTRGVPMGAMAVSGACLAAGMDTRIFCDTHFLGTDSWEAALLAAVVEYGPDVICFSAMTFAWPVCVDLARKLEFICKTPIIFGGWHVTGIAWHVARGNPYPELVEDFQGHPGWYGVVGEGYQTVVELIHKLVNGDVPADTKGIMRMVNGEPVVTPPQARLPANLWPEVDRRFDTPLVVEPAGRSPIQSLLTAGAGCRYHCINCQTPSSVGGVQQRSPEMVVAEMKQLVCAHGFVGHTIWFTDEDMGDLAWLLKICRLLRQTGLAEHVRWSSFGTASDFTRDPVLGAEVLRTLRSSGYTESMVVGVESANQRTLEKLGRPTSFEQFKLFVEMAKKAGISLWVTVMVGYPWETEAELRSSLRAISQLDIRHISLSQGMPLVGTPWYLQVRRAGLLLQGRTWSDYTGGVPLIRTPMDSDKQERIRLETILEFYTRRMQEHPEDYVGFEQSQSLREIRRRLGVR